MDFVSSLDRHTRSTICVLVAAITLGSCTHERDSAGGWDDVFRGQTVRIIVGVGPGGGQDRYARLTAAHLSRHLPGTPTVVVENMAGAGGLVAAQYLARRAHADALTLGLLSASLLMPQLVGTAVGDLDVRAFPVVGSPGDDYPICAFSRTSGMDVQAWLNGRVPRMGASGPHAGTSVNTRLIATALGVRIQPVLGYQGTADIRMAIHNREVDGVCTEWSSYRASFVPADDYVAAVYAGPPETGPEGVATASQLVKTDEGRELLAILDLLGPLARFYALPPATPPARVAILRRAFSETMADRDFLAAAAASQLDVRPRSAEEVSAAVNQLLSLSSTTRSRLAAILQPTESSPAAR
jgi:tripartite-type tricarboxylate transporter receptor subunit TctC